jgi:hypothetical protein
MENATSSEDEYLERIYHFEESENKRRENMRESENKFMNQMEEVFTC